MSDKTEPSASFRKLYLEAVKAMHPDLGTTDADRKVRNEWTARAISAYKSGNEAALNTIFQDWKQRQGNKIPRSTEGQRPVHSQTITFPADYVGGRFRTSMDGVVWGPFHPTAATVTFQAEHKLDIRLNRTALTNVGLSHLSHLTNLTTLDLGYTKVTDAGLPHLARLTNLRVLNLGFTTVTDSGLSYLKDLTNLMVLRLDGTQVTAGGILRLRRALPKAIIH